MLKVFPFSFFVIINPLCSIRVISYKEIDKWKEKQKQERKQKMMKKLKKGNFGFSLFIYVIVWPSQNKESSCAYHMGDLSVPKEPLKMHWTRQYIGQIGINRGTYHEIKDLNQDIMNTFFSF